MNTTPSASDTLEAKRHLGIAANYLDTILNEIPTEPVAYHVVMMRRIEVLTKHLQDVQRLDPSAAIDFTDEDGKNSRWTLDKAVGLALFWEGSAKAQAGRFDKDTRDGIEVLKKSLNYGVKYGTYKFIGIGYQRLREFDTANEWFRKAVEENPDDIDAQKRLDGLTFHEPSTKDYKYGFGDFMLDYCKFWNVLGLLTVIGFIIMPFNNMYSSGIFVVVVIAAGCRIYNRITA